MFSNNPRDNGGLDRMFVVDIGENIHISGIIQSKKLEKLLMNEV